MVDILTILILAISFVISIWNGYASGYNIGMVKKNNIEGFQKYAAYSGLGLGFVGAAYVMVVVISYLAYAIGYIDPTTFNIAISYDFLVFGLLIIVFGLMVTIQSILIAAKRRNIWSILIAVWNVFAEIWDIYAYVQGFKQATAIVGGGTRRQQGNAVIIVIIAALVAFFIVHAAYKHGYNKAMGTQYQQPQGRQVQGSGGGGRMGGQGGGQPF